MVIFFEWHPAAMEQTSRRGLPLSGEETDLEALSSPLVGYLGKVQDRAASLENCPWCISKSLTFALRSYRINLQESITLCTNPQCLFPLVSRPLEDVLASLVPADHPVGCKRKNPFALGKENLVEPAHKHQRSNEPDSAQNITGTLLNQAERDAPTDGTDDRPGISRADEGKVNGCHRDSLDVEKVGSDAPGCEDGLDVGPEKAPRTEAFNLLTTSYLPELQQPPSEDMLNIDGVMPGAPRVSGVEDESIRTPETLNRHTTAACNQSFKDETASSQPNAQSGQRALSPRQHVNNVQSDTEDKASLEETKTWDLLPLPSQLFWSNSENLCWLNSMLVALVNCKSLKKCRPEVEPQQSYVLRLIREYEEIVSTIQGCQQSGRDGVLKVSNNVLHKTNADLQNLRISVFQQLQPKLHCELGKEETPVFALPLLLAMDTWVEPLFQSVFQWEFKCTECGIATKERVRKTLPTFTDIVPNWHPLHAVHLAPCNTCHRKHQRRTMTLECVPPVFGLHFVQGLPDNNVRNYSFTFNRNHYSITTVIQYNQHLKHFVTWIRDSNGSWLEFDDLKHPECKTHGKLKVAAEEMHIVFWEVEEDKEPAACSPSSSFSDNPPTENQANSSPGDKELKSDELSDHSPEASLLIPHNDTAIVCALSAPGDPAGAADSAVDTSIGSTTLLDAFEGLSHDDIVTFTLVEITPDSDARPVGDGRQTPGSGIPGPSPDSSSAQPPPASTSPEAHDDPPLEPPSVTVEAKRGRGGRRGRKAGLSKPDPVPPPPASSEPLDASGETAPEGDDAASPQTTRQASPVSSSGSPASVAPQKATPSMPSFDKSRWSYLLSKTPLFLNKKPDEKLAPPGLRAHSTPDPEKGRGGRAPKAQLRKEDGSLPLKAAAMYNSFGSKSSVAPAPVVGSTPAFPCPVSPPLRQVPPNTTAACGSSPPSLGKRSPAELLSSRVGTHSKIPPGLSDTEALRYKLIKKLKAKKKKLAKLNQMLRYQGADSTTLGSPSTVTSSTYDGSVGDSLLLDLLSPATTASNHSPDSTSFLEMIAAGQEGAAQVDNGPSAASQASAFKTEPSVENFLDEFISQVSSQRPTEMETEALSALDLFV